jgi:hypothetical protein
MHDQGIFPVDTIINCLQTRFAIWSPDLNERFIASRWCRFREEVPTASRVRSNLFIFHFQ